MTVFLSGELHAQTVFDFKEDDLLETQWEYLYAKHPETNIIVHNAQVHFEYYVYFQFSESYIALLNGERHVGKWNLDGQELSYGFNGISDFIVVGLSDDILTLMYESPYTGQKIYYYFKNIPSFESPFKEQSNVLPKVLVDKNEIKKNKERSWVRKFIDRILGKSEPIPEPYFKIELVGGGYYGGINRVVKDYIVINNKGELIKEIYTEHNGLQKLKVQLDREMLLEFMEFVSKKGFFDLPRIIDCEDEICWDRKRKKPSPIPLRLSITYKQRRNLISIALWGKDHYQHQWIDYPKEIDAIIFAIQNMAHQNM